MTSQLAKPPAFARESFRQRNGWGLSECLFFCVIVLALAAVLWCGRFAYREGLLLEGAKANGQAIARWADGVAAAPAPVSDAVAEKSAERAPPTWQAYREALFGATGPFAKMTNPFNPANTVLGTKCERKSAATRGHVLVEKGTSPPPGVTGSVSWGPLEDKELMAKGLLLRVQVCDAGGYTVKVAEVTL